MAVVKVQESNESVNKNVSLGASNEWLKNQAILAGVVAGAAGGVFAGDLALIGLVALGVVFLPFTWPVVVGVLVGAAIVGAVALAVFYSSKNKMAEIIEPAKEISAQEIFILEAQMACANLRSGEMLTENTMQFVVLAMRVLFNRECFLTLAVGAPFQRYAEVKVNFVKSSSEKPSLQVRVVCIEGQGLFQGILSRLQGKAGYIENHATAFIENEYFDPKGLDLNESLHFTEPSTGTSVEDIHRTLDKKFIDYPHGPAQDFWDTRSCGVHVLRRIQQYFMETQADPLVPLSKQGIAEVRERFASLIEEYIIGENVVKVSAIVPNEDVSLNSNGDDF
jgi:hypothetical protein